jgi:hypothetical protein
MSIQKLRNNFKGVRGNRFRVFGSIPGYGSDVDEDFEFYCKAAQFPGSSVSVVNLNYRGRTIRYPAERTFQDWGVQIYTSQKSDRSLRNRFQRWVDEINSPQHDRETWDYHRNFLVAYNEVGTNNYLDYATLVNAFPIDISPIEFSEDIADSFAEFTVTLTFDYVLFDKQP